jgi:protein-tyrosine phosphatase
MPKLKVLFVCMGNVCRSPTAEGVLRHKLRERGLDDRVEVDSAGTHDWHAGRPPDERSQEHAARRGYDLSALRARQICAADLDRFDLVLVMDDDNFDDLQALLTAPARARIERLLAYSRQEPGREVPDPYAGGPAGFERVLDLIEDACEGLIEALRERNFGP